MKLKTRAVEIAGITSHPNKLWMTQLAPNLLDAGDGFLRGVHYLILDRYPLYSTAFRRVLRESGVKPLLLPARSPNLNAFCRTVCLVRQVRVPGPHRATRRGASSAAVRAFLAHYHEERPHQGLNNERIAPTTTSTGLGPIQAANASGACSSSMIVTPA